MRVFGKKGFCPVCLFTRTAIAVLCCLMLGACASGAGFNREELLDGLKKFPIRPYFTRQVLPGDPSNSTRFYGLQFRKEF